MKLQELPNDAKIEKTIIGCFLIEPATAVEFATQIKPEMFYLTQANYAIKAIQHLVQRGVAIDLLTTTQATRDLKLEVKPIFLNECTMNVNDSQNLAFYIGVLKELYLRREIYYFSEKVRQRALNLQNDPLQLFTEVKKQLDNSMESLIVRKIDTFKDSVLERKTELLNKENKQEAEEKRGIKSRFHAIDTTIGGALLNDNLIIIAGRPGAGKTSLALNIAQNVALNTTDSVLLFSLEMGKNRLIDKFIASSSKVDCNDIIKNKIQYADIDSIENSCNQLAESKIYIDDNSLLTPMKLRSIATNMKTKHDIKLIVIDYLQLMQSDDRRGKNREAEISEMSRSIKLLAKDLNIPIIALSQLSRACEARPDKRPILSDLRESGSIEQDADVVMFIMRPEYYNILEDENGESTLGVAELIFAKNRNGGTCLRKIKCDLSMSLFYEETTHNNYNSQNNDVFKEFSGSSFF